MDELLSQRTHVQNEKESWRNKANWLVGGGPAKEGITFVPQGAIDEAWERYNMYDQWEKELDEQIAQAHAAPGALEQAKAEGAHLLDAGAREQKKTAVRTKAQADADRLASYTSAAPGSDLQNMALLLAGASGKETAEKRAKELDFVGERLEDTYTADGFWGGHIGQFEANNDLGRINQESGEAWDDYLLNPTEENRERAFMYAALAEKVAGNAEDALNYNSKAKWLTQSVAGYLPQWWDQTKAQVEGGVAGAVAGSLGGAGGMITGARLGATAASSRESYHNMRGQAFRDLVMMGVDEVTAREAANDEAFLSALIEGAETYISFGALGFDELVSMFTGAAKKAGAKGLTTKLLSKLPAKWQPVAKVGMGTVKNAATEYAEEFAQQGVSIANQRRIEANGETGMLDLAGETAKVFGGAVTGRDAEALGQMHEAGTQGAILGAFGAGTSQVVNQAAAAVVSHARAKLDPLAQAMIGKNEQNDSTPTNDSGDIAAEIVNAGATEVEAEKLAPILTAVLTGEEISGNQAGAIAKNSAAVSVLESATGEAINTDAPLGEIKTTIRSLASRRGTQGAQTVAEDTPAQVPPAAAQETAFSRTRSGQMAVKEFAATLGKAGEKVFNDMYDGEQNAASYVDAMMKAYNAGKNGDSLESISTPGSNPMQTRAAYVAGQADATRTEQAAYFGKDAGVVEDPMLKRANLRSKDRRMLDAVGKVAGVKVRFVDKLTDESGRPANAQYGNGELLIALDTADPVRVAFTHEIVHRMREVSPEAYNALATFVQQNMNSDSMAVVRLAYSEAYGTDSDVLSEEIVAQAVGQMMSDSAVLEQFVKDDRNAGQKLLDAIKDMIAAIKRVLNGQNVTLTAEQKADFAELQANLEGMSNVLDTALKQMEVDVKNNTKEGNKNTATEGGEVKHAFKGYDPETGRGIYQSNFPLGTTKKEKATRILSFIQNVWSKKPIELVVEENGEKKVIQAQFDPTYDEDPRVQTDASKIMGGNRHGNASDKRVTLNLADDYYKIASEAVYNGFKNETGKDGPTHKDVTVWRYFINDILYQEYGEEAAMPYRMTVNVKQRSDGHFVYSFNAERDNGQFQSDVGGTGQNKRSSTRQTLHAAVTHANEGVGNAQPNSIISVEDTKINPQNSDEKNSLVVARSKAAETLRQELASIREEGMRTGKDAAEIEYEVQQAIERSYESLVDEYGAIPTGENPARDVRVPKRTADNQKVSQTVRTILEAKATPDVAIPTIEELTATGDFSYEVYTDKQAMADADNTIRDKGYNTALMDWTKSVQEGEVSKSNTALGWALYNQAANAGDLKTAMAILTGMVGHQRNAAQAVQATRILKKMSPEARLYGVQRSAQNLAEELEKRYGKDAPDIRVNEELARKYLEAETDKEREEAMRNLYRDLGRQMPSRFIDKWNAWRYLAMLGNPRTHVRNVLGNAFFAPVVAAKNMTAMAIEEAVYRVSGGKLERTKGSVGFGKQSRELLSAAWSDYESVADQVSSGGKYSDLDHSNQYIQEGRRIFKNRALEAARKGNSAALEAEDMWFSRPHYAYALAQYCKAHGITAEQMKNGKGLDRARAYAIKEAQKATYRDTNAFSQTISELGRYRGNNKVKKGVGVALEGILPFRKTPANILVRGLEYSPAGFLKGLFWDVWQIKSGKKTAAEVIDHISAGLTGSGLLALGAFLAAQGLVRGAGGDDEEKKEFEELQGHQTYAMELPGGTSVTLDWLAPEALPFFVGVNLWEQKAGNKDGGVTLSDILTATANVTEPLLELSCLQSLNDVFDAVGYAASDGLPALPSALASAATSYLTQGFPTILGQAERTGEDKRMSTYTEKNAFLTPDIQYTIGRISARLPGVDYQQIPYIDAWGRTENTGTGVERAGNNFLNPAYTSTVETSPMEDELLRLYEQTGEGSVLPSRAAKYFNVDGERKDLTAQEYVKYATAKGQTAYKVLTALTGSQAYRKMSDAEKAEAVGLVYDYANATAKTKVSAYKPEGWIAKAVKTEKAAGVKAEQYVTLYLAQKNIESLKEADGDTIANSKSLLVMEMVYDVKGLTDAQRLALFEDFGVGKSVIHYNKTLVQVKLNEMRRKAG
ncbi:MAG: hypothetical protein IJA11_08830 [Oscillospiraceae bacterium]|nr:hypothetical protein [Oscillospiraceae bacterium]